MKLLRLRISGYKNLDDIEFNFSKANRCSLIVGTNGSGKSNLLEVLSAIFFACYNNHKNVKPDFRFELEYIVERLRMASAGGGPSYAFPLRVMIRNVDGKIEVQVYQNDEWLYVNKNEWFVVLPERVIAIYSGEEKRLWEEYYFDSYDDFNKQYMSGKPYSTQRMLYFNKYYWDLFASILAVHDIEEHKQFLETINISGINKIKCTFDLKKIRDNKNEMAKEILKIINPDNLGEVELSLDKYEELKFLIGYEQEILFNMMVLVLYKEFKIITDFHVICSNDRVIKDLSEGEKKLLVIYGALNIVEGENLVLLDEPDAHVHEGIKKGIYDLIKGASFENQFIITSHSPTMTSLFDTNELFVLTKQESRICLLDEDKKHAISRLTNGEWSYIDQTLFFDNKKPVVIVEGKSDIDLIQQAIKEFSKQPAYEKYGKLDYEFLAAGGTGNIPDFYSKVKEINSDKIIIVLCDNDNAGKKAISELDNSANTEIGKRRYKKTKKLVLTKLPKLSGINTDFSIEDYFSKDFLDNIAMKYLEGEQYKSFSSFPRVRDDLKNEIGRNAKSYSYEDLKNMEILLDLLYEIGVEIGCVKQ